MRTALEPQGPPSLEGLWLVSPLSSLSELGAALFLLLPKFMSKSARRFRPTVVVLNLTHPMAIPDAVRGGYLAAHGFHTFLALGTYCKIYSFPIETSL
jgi:hypothetical protein